MRTQIFTKEEQRSRAEELHADKKFSFVGHMLSLECPYLQYFYKKYIFTFLFSDANLSTVGMMWKFQKLKRSLKLQCAFSLI